VVLSSVGRLDEAIAALSRAVALAPDNVASHRALGATHYNLGVRFASRQQWNAALASYQAAIRFDRELPEAFNGAGLILRRLRREPHAASMFEEAVRLRPDFAEARYNLAGTLVTLGRYTEAIESCRAALRVRPTLAPAAQLLDMLERLYSLAARKSEA
jgi:tetratricopeptide (TPR) repeat protein